VLERNYMLQASPQTPASAKHSHLKIRKMKQNTKSKKQKWYQLFKRTIIPIIVFLFSINSSNAQTPLDSANLELRRLFGNLSKPTPPKLFNWDMAAHFIDSNFYIPFNIKDTLDTDTWVGMYEAMTNCAYDTTILKRVDSVYWPALQYAGDTINMFVMAFDYYRFKADALTTNTYFDFDTIQNIITDKVIRPGFPYDDFRVFAAAPAVTQTNSGMVTYRVAPEYIFHDQFTPIDGSGGANAWILEIDFGDGNGYQNIIFGQANYFNVNYTTIANQHIQTRVRLPNNPITRLYSQSKLHNLQVANVNFLPDSGPTIMHDLRVSVYEPCSGTPPEKIKTIIYLEGIDMGEFIPLQNRDDESIYATQILATGLADLRNYGYRFVVVDWMNSRIDMRDNARNVVELIKDLKCNGNDNNDEQFVIIGESMGGVIARIAMMDMEQNHDNASCFPEKEHNTRLLITLDAPHGGAHIPMSVQKMASFMRNTGGLLAGGPLGMLWIKHLFKSNDYFLDGDAAKQLLQTHVSTGSILGPIFYDMHNKRKDLLDELHNKGDYPKHTKLMAISNGNMMGFNQTRLWDGEPRLDGDTLLKINARTTVRILGTRFNYSGLDLRLNGDPNGQGNLGGINFGTFWVKFKIKFFGIKTYTGFNSLCNLDWDANMRPVTNRAGGVWDLYANYIGGIGSTLLNGNLTYNGLGVWENINNENIFGTSMRVKTDGLHYNFVPVTSALDFGNALSTPFDQRPTSFITSQSPFDVSMGWQGDSLMGTPIIQQAFLRDNIQLRNRLHTDFRNDTLFTTQLNKNPVNAILYNRQCIGSGTNNDEAIRVINREIGDDEIYVENRIQPWKGAYSVSDNIHVNAHSPYYSYPNQANTITTLRSVWSKDKPYQIVGNGFGVFNLNIGALNYNPPFTGLYGQVISGLGVCCNTYKSSLPQTIRKPKTTPLMHVYPNPTNGLLFLEIKNNNYLYVDYEITDISGRVIYKNKVSNLQETGVLKIPVQLPKNLTSGLYLLHIRNNDYSQTFKINLR
jgi:pimeloyl-ACP methyl ester carboxylesterase